MSGFPFQANGNKKNLFPLWRIVFGLNMLTLFYCLYHLILRRLQHQYLVLNKGDLNFYTNGAVGGSTVVQWWVLSWQEGSGPDFLCQSLSVRSLNLIPVPVCFGFQAFHFTITYWLFIACKFVWQCACLFISALRWTADMSRFVPHHHTIPAGTGSSLSVPDKRGLENGWMGKKLGGFSFSHRRADRCWRHMVQTDTITGYQEHGACGGLWLSLPFRLKTEEEG